MRIAQSWRLCGVGSGGGRSRSARAVFEGLIEEIVVGSQAEAAPDQIQLIEG
jgi:hypothetical protein